MTFDRSSTVFPRAETLFADVIVPRHIAKAFTYLVPPPLSQTIEIGRRVLVPFGRVVLEGVVISLSNHIPDEVKSASFKNILSLVDDGQAPALSPALLELSHKIAQYYVAPWGQCLRLVFPTMTTRKISSARYVATEQGRAALETGDCPDHLRPTLERIARRAIGILSSTLQPTRQGNASRTIDVFLKKSWIALAPTTTSNTRSHRRRAHLVIPDESDHGTPMPPVLLTAALPEGDSSWKTHVSMCLQTNRMRKIVLHAPWQHRIRRLADAIQQAHSFKRSTIVLSGETARAIWLKHVLSTLTGLPITLAHSSSASDRWSQGQEPASSVIVGTRSAVFTPLQSVGLIWVEGEEDPALKEPQEPRYHAREVAILRAEMEQALVVLASAHPSLETKFDPDAESYHVRQEAALRPKIELVDLRHESGGTLFSQKLIAAMHEALENHARVLLFLNRKGYARTLVCRDCGWVPRCLSCAVPLTYFRETSRLACPYCGRADGSPDVCPACRACRVIPIGDGTERVEAEARRLFSHAKIARLDGEILRHPTSARALWERARAGAWDILIGTEALFRREPLPQHRVVGVLHADSGLHVSDFRAAERTYHLLVDAASLASPASAGGQVIVQTHLPTHHAVRALIADDPHEFYAEELDARRLLHYPPVCHLANLSVIGKDSKMVEEAAKRWGAELEPTGSNPTPVIVLGPVPAMSRRLQGFHHHRILAKGADLRILNRRLHESVCNLERDYRNRQIKFVVNMDPVDHD